MKGIAERLSWMSKKCGRFSNKLCLLLVLMAMLNYVSDRSYLVPPPQKAYGVVLYRPGVPAETGEILPGKLTRQEVSLTEFDDPPEEEEIVDPPLNIRVESKTVKELYESAYSVNNEVVGYIYIPNSGVSYPILHKPGGDNYYLKNNINNKKDSKGAIYLDDHCGGLDDMIKLIHGHSMRGGAMFGVLLNYKTQSWSDERPYVYIYDGLTTRVYEVFSCIVVNASNETVPLGFYSLTDKLSYFDGVKERSKIKPKDIADLNDLIILNTCSYEANNMRALVYASRVKALYDGDNMVGMGEQ